MMKATFAQQQGKGHCPSRGTVNVTVFEGVGWQGVEDREKRCREGLTGLGLFLL